MVQAFRVLAVLVAAILFAPGNSLAHHTYVTKYDSAKVVTLKGTIASVSYQNPHIYFSLVTANGTWTIETESIPKAQAKGLTEAVLADGAEASVTGWPARDGGAELGLKSITIKGRTYTIRNTAR